MYMFGVAAFLILCRVLGLIVIYDELFRQRLADRAYNGGSNSDPNKVVTELDNGLMTTAETKYRERGESFRENSEGAGKGKGKHDSTQASWNSSSKGGGKTGSYQSRGGWQV